MSQHGWVERLGRGVATGIARSVMLVTACLLFAAASTAQVRYYYDEAGRLIEVAAPDGASVQYSYDPTGNITAIRKSGASALSLTEFTPDRGPVGSSVTLYGSGFNTTAASNTVLFNGTAAVVSAATATSLTVAVPAAATTGKITVSNSSGSVQSASDFQVGAVVPAPTIASFTPKLGTVGTVVTVNGSNFQTTVEDNKVAFASLFATVVKDASSPTATQLKASVPNAMPSGRITVTTPYGKATSATDFYALPATVSAADVEFTGRVVVDGAALAVSTATAGKKAVILFDGQAGQGLHWVTDSGTFAATLSIQIYRPDGALLDTLSLGNASVADFTVRLPSAGTYTAVISPSAVDKGSVNLRLMADTTGTLTVDAALPTTVATVREGQNASYTFVGAAGQSLHLLVTGNTFDDANPGTNNYTYVTVYKPDGSSLTAGYQYTSDRSGYVLTMPNLATTGTYTVLVAPLGLDVGQIKLHLRTAGSGAALATNGSAAAKTVAASELGYYRFAGEAGKGYGVAVTGLTLTPTATSALDVYVYRPDGSYTSKTCGLTASLPSCDIEPSFITVAGNYSLVFVPRFPNAASFNVVLNKDAGSTLTVDAAAPSTVTLAAGQNASVTFAGTAGQSLHLLVAGNTFDDGDASTNNYTFVNVYRPDGSALASHYQYTSDRAGYVLALSNLPATGTYTVRVVPLGADAGQIKLHLRTPGSGAALAANGSAVAKSVAAGELGYYRFTGEVGKGYGVAVTGLSLTPTSTSALDMTLYRPDGSTTGKTCTFTASLPNCNIEPSLITVAGNYSLVFAPRFPNAASFNLALSKDAGGTLTVDAAAPSTVVLPVGQYASYTFAGTAGQSLHLLVAGNTFDDANAATNNYTYVYVYRPDGSVLSSGYQYTNDRKGYVLALSNLPVTGAYTVRVVPLGADAGQIKLHLRTPGSGAALATNGSAVAKSVATGELGYYRFVGEVGKGYGVAVTGLALTPTATSALDMYVYRPDGTYTSKTCWLTASLPSCDIEPSLITVAGNYSLVFVPRYPNAADFNVALGKNVGGTLTVDAAAPSTITLPAGQNAQLTFTGTAGQSLHLLVAGNTFDDSDASTNNYTYVHVYKPDGSLLTSNYQYTNNRFGYLLTMANLPLTGTYTVLVEPLGLDTGQIKLHLRTPGSGAALATNGSAVAKSVAAGELGYYRFVGEVGKGYGVAVTGLSFLPGASNPYLDMTLYRPDGSSSGKACTFYAGMVSCDIEPSLITVAGNYSLVFVPRSPNAADFNVVLNKDASETLTIDAAAPSTITLSAGQNASYTFAGTAGQRLHLLVEGNTFDDANAATENATYVYVYRPDGGLLTVGSQNTSNRAGYLLAMTYLPTTGNYMVRVVPMGLDAGEIKLHLRTPGAGTLLASDGSPVAANVPATQMGYYAFVGEAGKGYTVTLTGLSLTPTTTSALDMYLFRPDGSYGKVCGFTTSTLSCDIDLSLITAGGNYSLVFVPRFPNAASFNVALTKKP